MVVSVKLLEKSALQALWASKYNRIVKITMPIKGIRRQFADMADKNASDYLINSSEEIAKREMMTAGATKQLQDILEIGHDLDRIEAYDISNISGSNKVASMVVFMRGVPSTKNYRRFKIRTVKGSDDYACLAEALDRRFKRLKASEEKSFMVEPSLIIIDGGLGQLNISLAIMRKNNYNIPMIGIAKREETIVLEGGREILLPRNSLALHLIQRIRDEAHRFAVTYHRSLRAKDSILSELLSIEGVGSHTEKLLFEHFKTIDKIRNARIEEIMSIPRMSTRIAENIYKYFNLEDNAE